MDIAELLSENDKISELCCKSCNNFLSVIPILMDNDGNNTCGRCLKSNETNNSQIRNSSYETLASRCFFPCQYINDGCSEVLPFREVANHEQNCPCRIIKCPMKNCMWSGIPVELVIHYELKHDQLIIEDGHKTPLTEHEKYLVLLSGGYYFLVKLSTHKNNLQLQIDNLTMSHPCLELTFNCKLYTMHEKLSNVTMTSHLNELVTYNFDSNELEGLVCITCDVPADFAHNRDKIICPHCSHQMSVPILKCPEGHISCCDCIDRSFDFCTTCDEDEIIFHKVPDLEHMTRLSKYTCRWKDCNLNFGFQEIKEHERICPKRLYICLNCPEWKGLLNEVLPHDETCTVKTWLCPMRIDTQAVFFGNIKEHEECSLVALQELFICCCDPHENGDISISVCNCGPPSLYGWYRYQAFLEHVSEVHFSFNKTFEVNAKSNNRFGVRIPNYEFRNFNGTDFFKITVKIMLLDTAKRKVASNNFYNSFK